MPAQKKLESLSDAREILRQVRKSLRQSLGKYLRELDTLCTSPDVPPATRLQSLKLFLEYSTGGPPSYATAADLQVNRTPNTDEYKAWRAYELARFKAWQQANEELAPIDPMLAESSGQVALDIRHDGVGA